MKEFTKVMRGLYLSTLIAALAYAAYMYLPLVVFPIGIGICALKYWDMDRRAQAHEWHNWIGRGEMAGYMFVFVLPTLIAMVVVLFGALTKVEFWQGIAPLSILLLVGALILLRPSPEMPCAACEKETPKAGPRICPLCNHEFKGSGWHGMQSHWNARHTDVMPYQQFMSNMCREHRYGETTQNECIPEAA